MQLDPVRLKLLKLVKERRTDLKNVSLAIGRNAAYLHQFVQRGTPKVLPEDVRAALAELSQRGAELIDEAPRPGLFGLEVAFVDPDSVHGVLAEVVSRG